MNIKKIIGFVGVCSVCVLTAHAVYFQYPSFPLYVRLTEDGGEGNVIPKTYEKLLKALHDGGFNNGEFDGNIEKKPELGFVFLERFKKNAHFVWTTLSANEAILKKDDTSVDQLKGDLKKQWWEQWQVDDEIKNNLHKMFCIINSKAFWEAIYTKEHVDTMEDILENNQGHPDLIVHYRLEPLASCEDVQSSNEKDHFVITIKVQQLHYEVPIEESKQVGEDGISIKPEDRKFVLMPNDRSRWDFKVWKKKVDFRLNLRLFFDARAQKIYKGWLEGQYADSGNGPISQYDCPDLLFDIEKPVEHGITIPIFK